MVSKCCKFDGTKSRTVLFTILHTLRCSPGHVQVAIVSNSPEHARGAFHIRTMSHFSKCSVLGDICRSSLLVDNNKDLLRSIAD